MAAEGEVAPSDGRGRPTEGGEAAATKAVAVLAGTLTLIALLWAADVPRALGFILYTEQFLGVVLAHTFAIIFLKFPIRRGHLWSQSPPYDIAFAIIGYLTGWYVAVRYPTIAEDFYYLPIETLIVGALMIVLVLETLRRSTGWSMIAVLMVVVAYALFADLVPGRLEGRPTDLASLLRLLGLENTALFGRPLVIAASIVIGFVFLGQLLLRSGGAAFFTDLAAATMGRTRGGSAKIAIVASSLFGTISGSAVSNVVSTGVMTIPMMRRSGYPATVSAAIEAVASTGGQVMPPIMGAAAFLMAEFLQVPYTEVVLAAIVPALLYYVALFVQADLEAGRRGIEAVPEDQVPRLMRVIFEGWYFAAPFAVLIWTMFALNISPELAALYGSATLIVLGAVLSYGGNRIRLRQILDAAVETGAAVADIVVICAVAGMVIGTLNLSGLGFGLSFILIEVAGGSLAAMLAIAAVVSILLGMSMPTVSLYVLLAVLLAPSLVKLGIEPIAAHMFVLYFGLMSMVTPPVALCAFTAANLAGAPPMRTSFIAMRFGWTAYVVPFLFVFSPNLLLIGDPVDIAVAVTTAIVGVWFATAGIVGHMFRQLDLAGRFVFAVAGGMLLIPAQTFPDAAYFEITGGALAALGLIRERTLRRQALKRSMGS